MAKPQGSLAGMACHFLRPESFYWQAGGCNSACSSYSSVQFMPCLQLDPYRDSSFDSNLTVIMEEDCGALASLGKA